MCGIAGILGDGHERGLPLDALAHRGPDHRGEWAAPPDRIWLGHRRLSIIDLCDGAAQPMRCADGRYIVVFNGEIYNYLELRQVLCSIGYHFQTAGDTEVIAAAYDRWGESCQDYFNGMWAFALWDSREKTLFLSRDRYGKKPLYYFDDGCTLAFASEVQALHRWLGPGAPLNECVMADICAGRFGWHGTAQTYLRDVFGLPAGHCLRRTLGSSFARRWYCLQPGNVDVPTHFDEQAKRLRHLLSDACRIRLRSDVPLATCLSGGLDSAAVTATVHKGIMRRAEGAAEGAYEAFCAGFPGTMLDESAGATQLARAVGVRLNIHEILPPTPEQVQQAALRTDGPMHAMAFYPIWKLYGFIADHGVRVTLDGQGPDEMLGGYFETIRPAILSAIRAANPRRLLDVYRTYAGLGDSPFLNRSRDAGQELIGILKAPLGRLRREAVSLLSGVPAAPPAGLEYSHPIPPGLGPLGAELFAQFCRRQLPTILQQYDRCSMAHGVECRMPFMDHRLVEFLFSLPDSSRVGNGYTKRVLRAALRGMVPEATRLNRVKTGFNAPLVEWFAGPLREWMSDLLSSRECRESPYFDGRRLPARFAAWLQDPSWNFAWQFWPPVHYVLWSGLVRSFPDTGRHRQERCA